MEAKEVLWGPALPVPGPLWLEWQSEDTALSRPWGETEPFWKRSHLILRDSGKPQLSTRASVKATRGQPFAPELPWARVEKQAPCWAEGPGAGRAGQTLPIGERDTDVFRT